MLLTSHPSILELLQQGGEAGREALGQWFNEYHALMCRFVIAHYQVLAPQVDDVVSDFVCRKAMSGMLFKTYAPHPGRKFRGYLNVALTNYCRDVIRTKRREEKRQGGRLLSLDEKYDKPDRSDPDSLEVLWMWQVLAKAIRRMKRECLQNDSTSKTGVWGTFEGRLLRPFRGKSETAYLELVARYGFSSLREAQRAAKAGKRLFAETLLSVVSKFVGEEDARAELDDLWRIACQAGSARSNRNRLPKTGSSGQEWLVTNPQKTHDPRLAKMLLDPDFRQRRVWHPQELRDMLEHQWSAPLVTDLGGIPPGQVRLLTKLCDADRLLLRSYGDIFGHPMPPIELLEMVKDYAKRNMASADKELPEDIAKLLYVLSVVVARVRCGKRITSQEDETVRQNIEAVLAQPWVIPPIAALLREGLEVFGGQSVASEEGNAREPG